ncbi:MAG: hypothetical protein A2W74_03745 [Planctomycetes bacterium RIFCSPLOWO2_12_38_17]|nr:MAG: hypothetical protein A2W74_03745 [Planctomycetes bacterium RIFCSPLOWO2_12_38_17]
MTKTGKQLEQIVKQIEKLLLPNNFQVKSNERIFKEGVQIAEFDIEIEGRLGSTDIKWLIECRDRPSDGPAPGSWIEQLVGRRNRFGFNKVTAVSTTGFANGVKQFADESGIELRTVKEITFDEISDWFLLSHIPIFNRHGNMSKALLIIDSKEPSAKKHAVQDIIKSRGNDFILISTETGQSARIIDAFSLLLSEHSELFDDIRPDIDTKEIKIRAEYSNEKSHFIINTPEGNVRIKEIYFESYLSIKTEKVPIEKIIQYSRDSGEEEISKTVGFRLNVGKSKLGLAFHKLADTGEIHVIVQTFKNA